MQRWLGLYFLRGRKETKYSTYSDFWSGSSECRDFVFDRAGYTYFQKKKERMEFKFKSYFLEIEKESVWTAKIGP